MDQPLRISGAVRCVALLAQRKTLSSQWNPPSRKHFRGIIRAGELENTSAAKVVRHASRRISSRRFRDSLAEDGNLFEIAR